MSPREKASPTTMLPRRRRVAAAALVAVYRGGDAGGLSRWPSPVLYLRPCSQAQEHGLRLLIRISEDPWVDQRRVTMSTHSVANHFVSRGQALCLKGQDVCPTPPLVADIVFGHGRTDAKRLRATQDKVVGHVET